MARDDRKLGKYRDKRAPGVTNEPFGDESIVARPGDPEATVGAFVVHLHDATRRHYDFRLEVGQVLLSFAVPHGPSLDPAKKVLAVKTEDHPLEYIEFEDVIPEGQYGAGSMIVWDRGVVTYLEGPAERELATGKLHVEFRGMKLRGRWAFVKVAKGETGQEWLLFKKQDSEADAARNLTEELPRSVFSGLTVEELAQRDEIGHALVNRAARMGTKLGQRGQIAPTSLLAERVSPLATAAPATRAHTKGALYEPELDGVRVLAVRDGDRITLRTWSGEVADDIEASYPDVVRALRALPTAQVAIDGELVAFDATGHPSLERIAQRATRIASDPHRATTNTPVVLIAKDLLALGEVDVRLLPIESRRKLLASLFPSIGYLRASSTLEGDEARVLAACASLGIAAVVAKAKGSAYAAKDSKWIHLSTGIAPRSRSVVDHKAGDARVALRRVTVSNRDKVFWPALGYTKGDLIDYYANVADTLGPYLKDRPVILVRHPDGIDGKSFFQWNVPVGMPPWVRTLTLHEDDDGSLTTDEAPSPQRLERLSRRAPRASALEAKKPPKRGFLVEDASTLIYIANLGCIPLHVLASRAPDPNHADFLTIDFDVKQSELRHAVTLAQTLHGILEAIGLPSFPKTSGQTGLHVLVPLGPKQSFETARTLADLLGRMLVDRHPDIATMDRIVDRRGARVYVDTGQTGRTRAIVAPYSVRAAPGATVSTPLSWDEVRRDLDPRAFTIKTVPQRISERGDLLRGLLAAKPDIIGAVAKLAAMLPKATRPA